MREYADNSAPSMASEIIDEEGIALDRDDMDSFSGVNEDNELVDNLEYDDFGSSDDFDEFGDDDM